VVAEDLGEDIKSEMPTILSRQAKGTVSVNNNAAFSIGGLSKNVYSRSNGTIPPSVSEASQDTELMILILPHIIGTPEPETNVTDLVNNLTTEAQKKINDAKTDRVKQDYKIGLGYSTSLSPLDYQLKSIEGQLNLSPSFGLLAGTRYGSNPDEEYSLNYGGVVFRGIGESKTVEVYAVTGFGLETIKHEEDEKTSYKWFGRVGLDIKLSNTFLLGVGYNYMDSDGGNSNKFEANRSGCFARLGITF